MCCAVLGYFLGLNLLNYISCFYGLSKIYNALHYLLSNRSMLNGSSAPRLKFSATIRKGISLYKNCLIVHLNMQNAIHLLGLEALLISYVIILMPPISILLQIISLSSLIV